MSYTIRTNASIHCPRCGTSVPLGAITVNDVQVYGAQERTLRAVTSSYIDCGTHTCVIPAPSDGLMPVERFVKHDALDDLGAPFAGSQSNE